MTIWLVRAGKHGESEEEVLNNNIAAIGWVELPDLSHIKSREELKELFDKIYPGKKKMSAANEAGQVWSFLKRIKIGDLVILPSKFHASIAIGTVNGSYKYRTDLSSNTFHTRPVEWIKTDIPRTAFDQDLLYSLGAFMTVCQIKRNNAENRIKKILMGKYEESENANGSNNVIGSLDEDLESDSVLDIEQAAKDQISKFIIQKFKGHDLPRLVEGVLQAQGYMTEISKPGPDGGVDILAGAGPMGFDNPRICVQVKSSQSPVDVNILRSLKGTMNDFNADQGLLVSWGGFKDSVLKESKRSFFNVRLWDSDDLIKAIFKNYDNLSDSLQAELPLKRMWALVMDEE
ncbi:restriction endonuclease [Methanobacterium sp.]|uniref:restriction endonuclease n=1 Tax=Methanobacterium sp. TaxID=2164 RepID=UPI0031588F12